jgi:multidrug efflux pump
MIAPVRLRLCRILLTTAATVLGVVSLMTAEGAGAAARFAMGLVIFSGITVGTFFTLFVVQTFYCLISRREMAPEAEQPQQAQAEERPA